MGSWVTVILDGMGPGDPRRHLVTKEQALLSEETLKRGPGNLFKCYGLFCSKAVCVYASH